jgi:hypothetical protein
MKYAYLFLYTLKKQPLVRTQSFFCAFLTLLASLLISDTALSEEADTPVYLGVASCASSACHGGTSPRTSRNVFQNEYTIWFRHDAHSKAYTTLLSEESKIIGKHLGIEHPEKDETCLSCHSTQVPDDLQGKKFRVSDGVGCESCHGPASSYIRSHTELDRSYEENVRDGLRDLVSLTERTKLCLNCHQGNDEQFVNHRLIGAGHPRLRFELDTYGILQPHHWRKDDVYKKRKGTYEPVRAWLTGQVLHAKEAVQSVLSTARATQAGIPEFTNYYCYSCHHSLKEEQWKSREYEGRPGTLVRNTASLQMIVLALQEMDPALSDRLGNLIHTFQNPVYLNDEQQTVTDIITFIDKDIVPFFKKQELSKDTVRRLLFHLSRHASEHPHPPYEVAEQYAMAISALTSELDPEGTLYRKQTGMIYNTLKDEKEFAPELFTTSMKSFLAYLEKPHG